MPRKVKAWAIANKSGLGFITHDSRTVLAKKCKDYILHTSKENALRDLNEMYNPTGVSVVQVEIRPITRRTRK